MSVDYQSLLEWRIKAPSWPIWKFSATATRGQIATIIQ